MSPLRAALYARTSTPDQHPENQLDSLREFCSRRGWSVVLEYVDDGLSGTADRPSLTALTKDARRGRFDVIVSWRLDRVGRSLRALVLLLDEWSEHGIAFVSVNDGIDLSTPTGRFMSHMLGALAEYERVIIADRVRLGIDRARRRGKRIGRPPRITAEQIAAVAHLPLRAAAAQLACSRSLIAKWRKAPCVDQ